MTNPIQFPIISTFSIIQCLFWVGKNRRRTASKLRAMTLIEVIVALSILSVLLALSTPAIQSARESARRAQCQNNLRQIAAASMQFQSVHRKLPTNGWGFAWLGMAARGTGSEQPGGWIFQLLPFVEAQSYYDLASSSDPATLSTGLEKLAATPLSLMTCPSRPGPVLHPQTTAFNYRNANTPALIATTDYAINEGDWPSDTRSGPDSLDEGDGGLFQWADTGKVTGVSWQRGSVATDRIQDGSSHTYLIGEKRVATSGFSDRGNDQSMYSGVDLDITRWTMEAPSPDGVFDNPLDRRFGSAHASGCYMAMCDGSVQFKSYSIHPNIHRALGHRKDGDIGANP